MNTTTQERVDEVVNVAVWPTNRKNLRMDIMDILEERDRQMRARGYKHRVTAWIYPADEPAYQIASYFFERPTRQDIHDVLKKTATKTTFQIEPVLIGLWRFRTIYHNQPQWCCTWRFRGNYYDTFAKPTAAQALDAVYRNWCKVKKRRDKRKN